jgi:hypothetical protein
MTLGGCYKIHVFFICRSGIITQIINTHGQNCQKLLIRVENWSSVLANLPTLPPCQKPQSSFVFQDLLQFIVCFPWDCLPRNSTRYMTVVQAERGLGTLLPHFIVSQEAGSELQNPSWTSLPQPITILRMDSGSWASQSCICFLSWLVSFQEHCVFLNFQLP